jgi:serine/threonine protein kinase
MRFQIVTPNIYSPAAIKAGIKRPLKAVGQVPDGRIIMVDDAARVDNTSMVLFRGYLVPRMAQALGGKELRLDEIVAKFSADSLVDNQIISERKILTQLSELGGIPKIIQSGATHIEQFTIRHGMLKRGCPFFVMPRLPGEDLFSYELKGWYEEGPSRESVATLAVDILPALAKRLAKLHETGVVHRDVKPNNVLFDTRSKRLSLLDFGRANRLGAPGREDVGTFGYYPPELRFRTPEHDDVRTDTYGLGMTCFSLLSGRSMVVLKGMEDPTYFTWMDMMWKSRDVIMDEYYEGLLENSALSPNELVIRSNMHPELKETPIAKYIARLFHPNKDLRPTNMWQIAQTLRQLGGQLEEHIVSL